MKETSRLKLSAALSYFTEPGNQPPWNMIFDTNSKDLGNRTVLFYARKNIVIYRSCFQ